MRLLTKFETWLGLVAWLCDPTWWFRAFFILRATQKKACRQSEVARLYLFIFPPTWDLTDQVGKEEPKKICLYAPPRPHILSLGLLNKLCSTETAFSTSPAAKSSEHVLTSLIPSSGLCLTALLFSSPAWVCVLWPAYGDQFQFPGWLFGSLALSYLNWLKLLNSL